MNIEAKKLLKRELQQAENLRECFAILDKYYELENCKPGLITKSILIHKLSDAVDFMRAVPRKNYK